MNNQLQVASEPKLAEPGAGLSYIEMAVLKFIIKPFYMTNMDRNMAEQSLVSGHHEVKDLILKIKSDDLLKRVLVKRPYFVEDSSRYWSPAMLCNHLSKVNGALAKAIESGFTAIAGQGYTPKDRLKAVKPEAERNLKEEIDLFFKSVERIHLSTKGFTDQQLNERIVPHPWFGNLTHMQWIWFAGFHMKIHARQLKSIISALKKQDIEMKC